MNFLKIIYEIEGPKLRNKKFSKKNDREIQKNYEKQSLILKFLEKMLSKGFESSYSA